VELLRRGELILKRAGIIAKTLADMNNVGSHEGLRRDNDPEEEEIVIRTIEAKLSEIEPDRDIRTCSDFSHLHVECCEICHSLSPHYEMSLLDVEGGGEAWICCALDRALNPQKQAQPASAAAYQTLAAILGWINYGE
jgi:hypothetical protein